MRSYISPYCTAVIITRIIKSVIAASESQTDSTKYLNTNHEYNEMDDSLENLYHWIKENHIPRSKFTVNEVHGIESISLDNVSFLDPLVFKLPNLKTLKIANSRNLQPLADNQYIAHSIEHLVLIRTNSKSFFSSPISFLVLKTLEIISCSDFKSIPPSIYECKPLEYLKLDSLRDLEISSEIEKLENLELLELNVVNLVADIPYVLSICRSLKSIYIEFARVLPLHETDKQVGLSVLHGSGLTSPCEIINTQIECIRLEAVSEMYFFPLFDAFPNLKVLHIDSCSGFNSTEMRVVKCNKLETLVISHTPIQCISTFIGEFPNIRVLKLDSCTKLKCLPDSIGNCKHLNTLELINLEISMLPKKVLLDLNLQKLSVSRCSKLGTSFLGMLSRSITDLKLGHIIFSENINSFQNLRLLHRLVLYKCNIVSLPCGLFDCTYIKVLELELLPITSLNLPPKFLNLREVHVLKCSKLLKIPESFNNCSKLNELIVRNSSIFSIEISIRKLPCLDKLVLSECVNLTKLPADLFLGNISYIELDSLNVKILPVVSLNNIHLKELVLSGVVITRLPVNFENLKKLEVLDLSRCFSLDSIDSIVHCRSLIRLTITSCGIIALPPDIGRLLKLERLHIFYCRDLKEIPSNISDCRSLIEICLSNTSINYLPNSILDLEALEILDISNNIIREGNGFKTVRIGNLISKFGKKSVILPKSYVDEIRTLKSITRILKENHTDNGLHIDPSRIQNISKIYIAETHSNKDTVEIMNIWTNHISKLYINESEGVQLRISKYLNRIFLGHSGDTVRKAWLFGEEEIKVLRIYISAIFRRFMIILKDNPYPDIHMLAGLSTVSEVPRESFSLQLHIISNTYFMISDEGNCSSDFELFIINRVDELRNEAFEQMINILVARKELNTMDQLRYIDIIGVRKVWMDKNNNMAATELISGKKNFVSLFYTFFLPSHLKIEIAKLINKSYDIDGRNRRIKDSEFFLIKHRNYLEEKALIYNYNDPENKIFSIPSEITLYGAELILVNLGILVKTTEN